MINYRAPGRAVNVVAPGPMLTNVGYVFGVMFGVSPVNALLGDPVALWVVGIFEMPKAAAAAAYAVGDLCYWDDVGKQVTKTVATNVKIGVCSAPATIGATTVEVRLNGSF